MKVAKTVGIILVVVGALAIVGSVLADFIVPGAPGFGLQQVAGIVFGVIDVVLGLILLLTKKS